MTSTWLKLVVGITVVCGSLCARASTIVADQPEWNTAIQINYFSPVGQTFVATATTVGAISLDIQNYNLEGFESDRFVTVTLFGGEGFGGPVLASRTVDAAALLGNSPENFDGPWMVFDLGSVAVEVGNTYTFQVWDSTPRYGIAYHLGDAYAAGHAINRECEFEGCEEFGDGSSNDLAFRVTASAVPESSTYMLLTAGLGILLLRRRRA